MTGVHGHPRLCQEIECSCTYMPAATSGKAYKLAQSYHAPYRVITTSDSTVEVCPVDRPNASSIHVALDCIRVCQMCSGPRGPALRRRPQISRRYGLTDRVDWSPPVKTLVPDRDILMLRRGGCRTLCNPIAIGPCTASPSLCSSSFV